MCTCSGRLSNCTHSYRLALMAVALLVITTFTSAPTYAFRSNTMQAPGAPALAGIVTTVIQPGPEGKDTFWGTYYVKEGSPDYLELYNGGWGDFYYDYLEFNLAGAPAAEDIEKVEFQIYATNVAPNNPFIQVYRITEGWAEADCSRDNNPTSVLYGSMEPIVPGWNVVDITALYKGWMDGSFPNHGIKLAPTRNGHTNGAFASSDNPTPDIRPKLVIQAAVATPLDGTWVKLLPGGNLPPPRELHTAVYVPSKKANGTAQKATAAKMIVFGGYLFDSMLYDDLWCLSLGENPTWQQQRPSRVGPSARYLHTAIYDPSRRRMIVFGGSDGTSWLNDVWALSLPNMKWKQLFPAGGPPQGRTQHSAIYDPIGDRMIIHGAYHGAGISQPTWQLSFEPLEWIPLAPGPTPMRGEHSAVFDPVRNRMLVFAGDDGPHPHENDTWSMATTGTPTWNELYPTGPLPRSRWGHSAIYDPIRDRLVVHGGVDEANVNFADQWAMSLDGPPQWSRLLPIGAKPQARREHTAIYDPAQDRMVIFGGRDDTLARLNDTWALNWNETPTDVRDGAVDPLRESATLFQNTPNPFNPTTMIHYQIHRVADVRLDIFDVQGRLVRNLVRRKQAPETYSVQWDGNDEMGRRTPSGTYFYQLVVDNVRESRKMVVLK